MTARGVPPLLAVVLAGFLLVSARAQSPAPGVDAECAACHEDRVNEFANDPHVSIGPRGLARKAGAAGSCTACHGDATAHLEAGGGRGNIFAFHDADPPLERMRRCEACHAQVDHVRFRSSPHAQNGIACTACHQVHGQREFRTAGVPPDGVGQFNEVGAASRNCQQCHTDVFAEFRFPEHHRLREGILECSSCHDPHGPSLRLQLGGIKQQQCAQCHSDKEGPWVFEHGGQRVEGCTACHAPHGSPNRHMLTFQKVANLCYSCHDAVPAFHSRFNENTMCTNCHSQIHGSNLDPWFLK